VETEGADAMSNALAAGEVVRLPAITSIARTLGAPAVSPMTLVLAQRYVEEVVLVSDADAVRALQLLLERTKILTEPAASCTLAAAEKVRDRFDPKSHVALVLCGGNVSVADICNYKARFNV
jgi:threonine dehydratase